MRTVDIPADALMPGCVIEATGGALGVIVMHGWDMEGSFGYFVRCNNDGSLRWGYHHRGKRVWMEHID